MKNSSNLQKYQTKNPLKKMMLSYFNHRFINAVAFLGLKKPAVLDAGCGNGHLCRYLAARGAVVTGTDSSKEMIKACESYRTGERYVVSDITREALFSEELDWVIFNNSLQDMEHFERGIANAYAMLAEGGRMLILVKHPCFHPDSQDLGWRIRFEDGTTTDTGQGLTEISRSDKRYTGEVFRTDRYFEKSGHTRVWFGHATTSYSRTLEEYFGAIFESGFILTGVYEPRPLPEGEREKPDLYRLLLRIPNYIVLEAVKGKKYECK